MAQYRHLELIRQPETFDRRKTGRLGPSPKRGGGYGRKIGGELDQAVAAQRAQRAARFVDPSLILRVKMDGATMEDEWAKLGLTLLASDDDNTIILFSSNDELEEFRDRLTEYEGPIPQGQKERRFASFIDRIGGIGTLEPRDRLGVRLKEAGIIEPEEFLGDEVYTVDIELWEFGPVALRRGKAEQIIEFIEGEGGELLDHYSGPSITMIRVTSQGKTLQEILKIPEVAFVDLPPEPDLEVHELVEASLDELPPVKELDPDLPLVAVLDSGVNDHPFLEDAIVARIAFPEELGEADVWGHGTGVSGIVALGDLRSQLDEPELTRVAKIVSAKVITDDGQFFNRRTLPTQMREAIRRIHDEFGCRIFVLSLGDKEARYEIGRVGPWATTLDELARELDVLIFVSAGNRCPRNGMKVEEGVTGYPGYLLEDRNRVLEPAGGANVVTVGSLSHGNGLGAQHQNNTHVRAITTEEAQPSPFTRKGPGAGGINKPDFVDYGGTMVFDAMAAALQDAKALPSAGLLTTNNDFLRQLLVCKSGTSVANPMLAHKAAQLLRRFPEASANLIKSLMAGAAAIPEASQRLLRGQKAVDQAKICGKGLVDEWKASFSDDHRVVLYAEDSLGMDQFAVYKVPIPDEFQARGKRTIRVSLAFDPPVKRTRAEYVGTKMNFRLIRGCPVEQVFEHFKKPADKNGKAAEMPGRFDCDLEPKKTMRDRNTIQSASIDFTNKMDTYGDEYYLVVRCIGGWAVEQEIAQRFAVTVELEHQEQVQIYARIQQRVRV